MAKRIIFVHGRAQKPSKDDLQQLWYEAINHGLLRDVGLQAMERFQEINKDFIYYGDLSNDFLQQPTEDIGLRYQSLERLKSYTKQQFNKASYHALTQAGFLKEALADIFSAPLGKLGVATPLIKLVAPDMAHYWNGDSYFASDVRSRLTPALKQALDRGDDIMLVGHSLGSMICFDNLWKLSHYGEYRRLYGADKKVNLFVTLGSPLADENVKQQLKGSRNRGFKKYPTNIKRWCNFAAEDDFISHDTRVSNDYDEMSKLGLLKAPIEDFHIYNLTVMEGRSNPHASIGYLIHPDFISVVNHWINN
ncbi:hypothetical protein MHN79_19840 [Vibrio sp. Of14-4]|uniref:hypothetical protein n=1 Tax=Vibrio sp. Of14-4 TaxID=2724878 RepID=UPI001EF29C1A|nr:hypothetical protein [Vibrio sp. Of14-4]MCG7491734.1 hypothetical protein [Vibrio sp. Of14-4]